MITVTPADSTLLKRLTQSYQQKNLHAMVAFDREELLGACIFSVDTDHIFVYEITTKYTSLVDGLARSAFHFAANREIAEARFSESLVDCFMKLRFIQYPEERSINIPRLLASGCRSCNP